MQNYKARQTALLGMLFALSMALSFLESMLTPFFGLMPAMKLGLSNIVVMYAVLFLNRRSALYLVLLKALFALLTRGVTAGFLSLCGGALSLAVFCLLLALPFTITGYIFSVSGALAHNCGQLLGGCSAAFRQNGNHLCADAADSRSYRWFLHLYGIAPDLSRCQENYSAEEQSGKQNYILR